jgi:hypothetical protein
MRLRRLRRTSGPVATVTKHSSASARTSITGYTFLQAGSMEEAVYLMKNHPKFFAPGSSAPIWSAFPCRDVKLSPPGEELVRITDYGFVDVVPDGW